MQNEDAFQKALSFTLRWEGSYNYCDPDDSGGCTMKGITQNTYDEYLTKRRYKTRNVRDIEDSEVEDIYRQHYWYASQANLQATPQLAIALFDFAVNSGPGRAKRYLANCRKKNFTPVDVLACYLDSREQFFHQIAKGRNSKFLSGWLNRVKDLRRYLTEEFS